MSSNSPFEKRDLSAFFHPRSVVLVGGSDRSAWSHLIFGNLRTIGFSGTISIVNQRGNRAHGLDGFTSCADIPETPDLAYVFVPQAATTAALEDVGKAGIRNVILLTSGYAEAGAEGLAQQEELVKICRRFGLNLLGPNGLGFINYPARVALAGFPVDERARAGGIAVVSQSGATAHVIARFAQQQGIGLSTVVATGNEADIAVHDVIAHLAMDPHTRAIALFAESIRNTAAFLQAIKLAEEQDKPVVVLKVGRSSLATKLAQAHTGSVTGDDRVFDTICKQHNIIRVDSIESLTTIAGLIAATGRISGGLAVASISGGACEIIADRAEAVGLVLPELAPETQARLQELLPEFGSVNNPLDVTGAAVREPELFEKMLKALGDDPSVGLVACVQDLPSDENDTYVPDLLASVGKGLAGGRRPGLLISQAMRPLGAFSHKVMEQFGIKTATSGIDHGIEAIAAAQRWSAAPRQERNKPVPVVSGQRPGSEREALAYLSQAGVGVVPHRLATSAAEAVAIWEAFGGVPVALKVASPDIPHKSDIGGVKLGLDSAPAVSAAFTAIMQAAAAACPDARTEGCIMAPMRTGGVEMFVGTARTAWGTVIAAGLGGIWIEALADTSLRLLPLTQEDALAMLGELKGSRLLDGYRGAPAVDRHALADMIVRIGDAALALGPDLVSLEVNPVLVRGSEIEALDALTIWDDAPEAAQEKWNVA